MSPHRVRANCANAPFRGTVRDPSLWRLRPAYRLSAPPNKPATPRWTTFTPRRLPDRRVGLEEDMASVIEMTWSGCRATRRLNASRSREVLSRAAPLHRSSWRRCSSRREWSRTRRRISSRPAAAQQQRHLPIGDRLLERSSYDQRVHAVCAEPFAERAARERRQKLKRRGVRAVRLRRSVFNRAASSSVLTI